MFCLVSFEGPDDYARVGGLAAHVTGLASELSAAGFETHLFYFGDPRLPAVQRVVNGHLTLHRWAQWLSATAPGGVYELEDARRWELATPLPAYLLEHLVRPLVRAQFTPVILATEWQTLEFLQVLDRLLRSEGLRSKVVLAWDIAAPSLERITWSAVPKDVRLVSHDPEVLRAGMAAARSVFPLNEGADGVLMALLGQGAQSAKPDQPSRAIRAEGNPWRVHHDRARGRSPRLARDPGLRPV